MKYIIYFLIAIGATTSGALTGIGGGVIIKPLMDALGDFDIASIGIVSSITVFSMSVVSIGRHVISKTKMPYKMAVFLALGSVGGGYLGQWILSLFGTVPQLKVIQNIILTFLILGVFIYMKNKSKIKGFRFRNPAVIILTGCFLGCCSAFLGIGGGPINVAVIILLFSVDTKSATVCSLMTILFAQLSKLITVAFTTGFAVYDLSVAPLMVAGAIAGGLIGASLNKKFSEKSVEKAFNALQIVVMCITIYNIISNII